MAVNKNTNVGAGFENLKKNDEAQAQARQQAAQGNAQPQQNAGQQQQKARPAFGGGITDINRAISRPISRQGTGERVSVIRKMITETLETNLGMVLKDSPFRVIPIDAAGKNAGPLDMVLVTYQQGNKLTVYTLLVGQENLASKTINYGGRTVDLPVTSGDIYNDFLWERIRELVLSEFGKPDLEVLEAGDAVIPTTVREEDESRFHAITFSAVNALMGWMERMTGDFTPVNVGMIASTDRISSEVEYLPGDVEDSFGNPVRSDIALKLRGSVKGQQPGQYDQVVDLARVDGFVDLVYAPDTSTNQMGMPMSTQTYVPNMIVSRVDSQINIQSTELQLLGLVQTRMLSGVNRIIELFRPSHSRKGVDYKDIGAFGMEAPYQTPKGIQGPPGKPWDTKSSKFSDEDFYRLFVNTVRDDVVVSMDVEEHGDLTWINDVFLGAANGSTEAHNAIVNAADNLTNGSFSQIFAYLGGGPLVHQDNNRIHLGYYYDEEGRRRDIRDIDYLAVLNNKDLEVVATWSESFNESQMPLEMRMDDRLRILNAMLGKVHVTGYATRVTFTPQFIAALDDACRKSGLNVVATNFKEVYGTGHRQGSNIGQYALNNVQAGSSFVSSHNPYAGYQGPGMGGTRWQRQPMGFNNGGNRY